MVGAYGEAGPWGVWIDKDGERGEPHWYEHHRGGPRPCAEEHARALATTLTAGGVNGECEARPLRWDDRKHEYVGA